MKKKKFDLRSDDGETLMNRLIKALNDVNFKEFKHAINSDAGKKFLMTLGFNLIIPEDDVEVLEENPSKLKSDNLNSIKHTVYGW